MAVALGLVALERLAPDADAAYGGKACGLARLLALGVAVPPGFALAANAGLPGQWSGEDRERFLAEVAALLPGPLAVRSSAVGEDSASRSFAGLLETVLGVDSAAGALAAVERCVASGGAERVLAYAGATGPLAVGVVVQRQVVASRAGVCFTRDPAGRDSALVVEAVAGTGDSLVSGRAEPERWRAYRSGLGGFECRCEPEPKLLAAAEVARLAAGAAALETGCGFPLDLEWALDDAGALWWLQARPITALAEPPVVTVERSLADADDGPVTVWSNWNVRETMPDPLHPLTWSVWREDILPIVTRHLAGVGAGSPLERQLASLDLVQGRMYINFNAMLAMPVLGALTEPVVAMMDSRTGVAFSALRRAGVLRPRRLPGNRLMRLAGVAVASLRGFARFGAALRPRHALAVLERDGVAIARRPPLDTLTDAQLLAELALWSSPGCRRLLFGLQMEGVASLVYGFARTLFGASPRAVELLATGIPANPTTQISLAVDELTRAARPLASLFGEAIPAAELLHRLPGSQAGPGWLAEFDAFLVRFGHRGPAEFDLAAPRWGDDPTMIVELVRAGLRCVAAPTLGERLAALATQRRQAIADAVAAAPAWKRPLMRWVARQVELYMPLREAPKHHGMHVFQRMRRSALELGRRLTGRAVLERPEDVFLLELSELRGVLSVTRTGAPLSPLIERRRAELERFRQQPAPDMVRSDGVPVLDRSGCDREEAGVLRGTPVSAGRATGPVRRLAEPDPRLVGEREVLVMRFADPGWTPLFPRAAAVVMEVGGLMCHAAVVARELGVPAVFGVSGVTSALADGETVTVDGSAGTVTRASAGRSS